MQLIPGTRLGPYEILSSIGAGGMGEVYRARDTRLDRSVAIKVLPRVFATDPDRRTRFEREARVVAGVSHPNVCALHDVGVTQLPSGDDVSYLVMEHLDGETLDRRISRGPLSLDETVRVAADIARGLDAAHRQRIVHRDLKPSNIMLTRSGVKLLDFGLAKAIDPVGESGAGSTIAATGVTAPGTVLGTVPYMAPEQIEGQPVDSRADIFALGCVIYEMASGRRAFTGESPAAVASAILASEPAPLAVSRALDRTVRGCLRKKPDDRWQSAHDVALQLDALNEAGESRERIEPRSPAVTPWVVASVAGLIAIVAALAAWSDGSRGAGTDALPPAAAAFTVAPPDGSRFLVHVEFFFLSVSPDGSAIAYVAAAPGAPPSVWVRDVASTTPRPIPGTEHALSVFWSPDSKTLGFFADAKLKRVDVAGGAPVTLCPVPEGIGLTGTWGAHDILFAAVAGQSIMRVAAQGGTPAVAMEPDATRGEFRVAFPSFLPDGRRYLYLAGRGEKHTGTIRLGNLDGESIEVMRLQSMAQYVEPGYLVFVEDSALLARRFDPDSGQLSGTPIAIADRVNWLHSTGVGQFSASPSGVIAFLPHKDESRIAAFDRRGTELREVRPRASYQGLRISPDGREMLFDLLDARVAAFDVWSLDVERGSPTRLTSEVGSDISGTWAPGGGYIYSGSRGGAPRLHIQRPSSEEEALNSPTGFMQIFPDVSPDGKYIVFAQRTERGAFSLYWMTLADRRPQPLHPSIRPTETAPRFSPDGRYLVYESEESGRREVYVEPFPSGAGRKIVSIDGGRTPRWSRDGTEVFYLAPNGAMKAARVSIDPLHVGSPVTLFDRSGPHAWADFDVTADGRFFANVPLKVAAEQPFTVLVNWPTLVKQ